MVWALSRPRPLLRANRPDHGISEMPGPLENSARRPLHLLGFDRAMSGVMIRLISLDDVDTFL